MTERKGSEREVVFESAGLKLSGTMAVPELAGAPGPVPAVLMVPGSGQVDRDENHKRMRINVLGELAGHLAAQGIASLRYDKRGVGKSEGDFLSAGFHDNVADAAAALAFLGAQDPVDGRRLFLLGHSEGAYIVTRLAAVSPGLAGVILLAGGARSAEEELRWQGAKVGESLTGFSARLVKLLRIDLVKSQAKQLEKIKRSQKDWYRVQLFAKVNAKWMRELLAYDPAEDLARIQAPLLGITGSKDIQVDPGNLERMAALVRAPFEAHVVPDVSHILRADPGAASLAAYKKQAQRPVEPKVVQLILDWLDRQTGGDTGVS